jgi:hypothetical protein
MYECLGGIEFANQPRNNKVPADEHTVIRGRSSALGLLHVCMCYRITPSIKT